MLDLLFIHWHVDPVFFHIGPLQVRWYSLLFVSGFILGWYIFRWFFRREGVSEKLLDSLLYTLLIATIVGSRLGHCIFYQPDYFFGSWHGFWEIFQPWKGGLASHGGAIALLLAMWWYSAHYGKKNGFDFLWIMDHLCIAVAFAACFIRLGNLFNSEIYGVTTSLPWGFVFELRGETEPKHPAMLYESLTYLVLGLVLIWIYWKKLDKTYRGFYFGAFLLGCFGMRFIIEYVKTSKVPFPEITSLNMGQLLSIPFIIAGVALMVYAFTAKRPARAVPPTPPAPKKPEATHYARSLRDS